MNNHIKFNLKCLFVLMLLIVNIFTVQASETAIANTNSFEGNIDPNVTYSNSRINLKIKSLNSTYRIFGSSEYLDFSKYGISNLDRLNINNLINVTNSTLSLDSTSYWYSAQIDENTSVKEVLDALQNDERVLIAEPDYYRTIDESSTTTVSNDPFVEQQWYLDAIKAPEAWNYLASRNINPGGNRNIIVAVIDTGVDYNHIDLSTNIWTNPKEIKGNGIDDDNNGYIDDYYGVNVVRTSGDPKNGDPMDDNGHGTHVAGIIAAINGNGIGGTGIAYNVRILPIKAAQASGYLTSSDIAEAITYATSQGADVINMSFGGATPSNLEKEALALAFSTSVLVAAAGNQGYPNEPCSPLKPTVVNYPAGYTWVIGVMASDVNGELADFSNFDCEKFNNPEYEMTAPGTEIFSTLPNNKSASWSGTSMSTPMVSSAAALIRSAYNDKSQYSSRFIAGQLVSANQIDSNTMNLDIYSSLTNSPVPKLKLVDTVLFDDTSISTNNNGNGLVDSGETIQLGMRLMNYWGTATNVRVHIESMIADGVPHPDVQISKSDVSYNSIGNFSTSDNGYIYINDKLTGLEFPFVFTLNPDTANNTIIPFQVTIYAQNGAAGANSEELVFKDAFEIHTTSGSILPSVISSDMTLTKNKLWIVGKQVIINSGVTLTIEPGTRIQFFTNDVIDESRTFSIPQIIVEGSLVANGTLTEPIEMFPSNTFKTALVKIERVRDKGYVEINYAIVHNPYLNISKTDHSRYVQDFTDTYLYSYDPYRPAHYWMNDMAPNVIADVSITNSSFSRMGKKSHSAGTVLAPVIEGNLFEFNCLTIPSYNQSTVISNNVFRSIFMTSDGYTCSPVMLLADGLVKDNAFVNPWYLSSANWMEVRTSASDVNVIDISGNYWGTSDENIDVSIFDKFDYHYSPEAKYLPKLETPPETAYPFVTDVYLTNANNERVSVIGVENATLHVEFNRAMDMNRTLNVAYGPQYPSSDYLVEGNWVDSNSWVGTIIANSLVGGYQYFTISNAVAESDPWLNIGTDYARFRFRVDNNGVSSLSLKAIGYRSIIGLNWTQDDYELIAGYNVYRSTSSSGNFEKLNQSLIIPDTTYYFDNTVLEGKTYYYKFSVVLTDLSETSFSNVVSATTQSTNAAYPLATSVNIYRNGVEQISNIEIDLNSFNKSIKLSVINSPESSSQEVLWSSSDKSVIAVDPYLGIIYGLKSGSAVITAKAMDGSGKFDTVNVIASVWAKSIEVIGSHELFTYKSTTLSALITPSNTTNKTITWTSSDSSVASVDGSGKVTGHKEGNVTIRATSKNLVYGEHSIMVKDLVAQTTGIVGKAISSTSNELKWSPVEGAEGYEVHFSKGTSLTYTLLKSQTGTTPVIHTGLTPNTIYNYKVRAYRVVGTTKVYGAYSEISSFPTPPLSSVLKVVSKNATTLSLSWTNVTGITEFNLFKDNELVDVYAPTVLSAELSGLVTGQTYQLSLHAINGELGTASIVNISAAPIPIAVSNLKISEVRFNGFSLDWDEVAGADHYDVFQGTSSTAVTTKVGSVTDSSFTTTTLLNFNTTYYYKVVPVTLSGLNGTASMILTGKTAISAPTGVSVSALSGISTSVSYEAVNGAAGYEVHFSKGTSLTYTLLKAQTTLTPVIQTGLTANTVYNYKVRAYRMAGTTKVYSAFSDVKTITTPPSTPVLKVVSKNSDTLSLSWVAVPGATQYELYQNSVLIDTLASSVLSQDITGLELGSSYKYTLVALNGELRSASSVEVTGIPVPAAVGNLKFSEVRFNGFSLDWDEVSGADHYDVFQGTSSTAVTTKVGSVTDSQFSTVTLLNFNTSYYYKVVPVTLSGLNGTASIILTGKTAISAPRGVSVSALSGSSTSISYEAVNGAAGYEVHFSKGTSLTYTLLKAQTTVTPVVQTGLTANTVYNYKVRTYRMAGTTKVYSAFSEVKSITTPPSTPVLKVMSKNSDTLSLSWAAVPGATQYELYQNSVLIDTLASSVLTKDISGLELGSSYKYTLVALNGELRSASSVEVTGIPVPAAVSNLKFSEIRFNGFSLDWDEVAGADHYDVFQGTSSTAVTTKVGSVTDSNFTTTTLLNFNTTYYYKVVPVTLTGLNGSASMILTGKTAISAPTGVSVTALSGNSTSISYEAVNGAAGYEVHYSKGTSLTYTLLKAQTTVTPVVQTGLTANTVYNYKVRAYRMAGTTKVYSAFSEVKSITTPPSTPVIKVVSKNSDTLSLTWVAVPGATQYELYQNSVLVDTLASSVLSKDISGLELGSSYKYKLIALNGELRSVSSVEVTGIPVPAAVGNLKFSEIRFNGFSLDWDEVVGADHYDVFQGTSSTAVTTKVGSVTDSSFTTTTLLNFNTTYYYKVVPVTLSGLNGTASMILTGKTAISAPSVVSVSAISGSSTSVSYEAVNGAAGYEVHYSKGTSLTYTLLKAQTTVTPIIQTGLTANTVYNYKVRAYRMAGTTKVYSAFSEVKSITTPPSTPVLKAVSKNSSTLTLSWVAVPGATSYEVYKDATLLDTVSSSVLSLDVNSLNVGQSYGFYIVALNGELRSSNSTVVNGVPVPGAISNFKVVDTQYNGFTLDWDGVVGADHYDVFQGTTSTTVTTKLASVTESEFKTTASLNFNTSYYYKVVPVTSGGLNGNASSVLTAKTALAKPLNVVGNYLTNTSIELKWDAVSGAAGYEISYSKGTSSTYTVLRSVTTLSTTHTGLTENTAYNYRVRAYRMSGTVKLYSAYSDLVTPVLSMYEAINLLEYNDITSLDIHVAVDDSSWSTLVNTMEGLVSLSKTAGEVESGVASSWSFDEPTLTWTFNLNPNAVWVNNQGVVQRSVTASDFVYAWDRLAADTNYQYNYYLDYILFIESYQAVNATTLKVKVTEYQPFFLNSLVKPNMFPMAPENLSTFGAEYGNSSNSVWYNGAYYLSSWNKGVNAKWTKNNKYWNAGIVKTPEVNIKFDSTGDLNAELTEFDTGLIDLMTLSGDNYASRKNDSSLVLFPESAMYYLFMNTANSGMINGSPVIDETAGNPLFDNRKIRQAIAYYLDKEKVTNAIGSYPYKVANYFVPSNFVSYNGNAYESSRGNGYMLKNQDLARSLFVEGMTELGYVEGDNTLSVDYVVYESTIAQTIADTIISDLNVLFNGYGITVNKRVVPFVDFLSELDNGSYDMAYMGWGPDYRWPTTYLDNYLSYSAYNNIGYNNSTYDDLLNPYGKTMSQVWSDLQLAEKVLLEDASFIPISQRVLPKLVSSRLKGVSLNYSDIGLYYKWIYKE